MCRYCPSRSEKPRAAKIRLTFSGESNLHMVRQSVRRVVYFTLEIHMACRSVPRCAFYGESTVSNSKHFDTISHL